MHHPSTRAGALDLLAAGLPDRVVAERLGVPSRTISDWRTMPQRPRDGCPRCWRPSRPVRLGVQQYAELLGLYLGDGHISRLQRTQALRLSLDAAHPRVVTDAEDLLTHGFPDNRVQRLTADRGRTVVLKLYHGHLTCLFPQAGSGKKHTRAISLEPWQVSIVEAAPWALLRGLIRSDGCIFVNRTGPYSYVSYDFSNRSQDILGIFSTACDQVGVAHRRNHERIRICRREAVALMQEHVGVKG